MIAQDPAFNSVDKPFLRNHARDPGRPNVRIPDSPYAWHEIDQATFALAPFLEFLCAFPQLRNERLPLALMDDKDRMIDG